jgi:pyridoxine 5-phosphate synthase
MKTKLSVNLNKVALLRNSRDTVIPSVVDAAVTAIEAGADGITVHPRPDMRHIRPDDVYDLAELLSRDEYRHIEFNIEGNPFAGPEDNGYPGFISLIEQTKPHQATLVPDDPMQLTSDHGWDLSAESNQLKPLLLDLQSAGVRVSLFMDPVEEQLQRARHLGTDRIEFYTGPFADHFGGTAQQTTLDRFTIAAGIANDLGLGINAGHDLNLQNLAVFCSAVSPVAEVSIGHAIVSDALWLGLSKTVSRYVAILEQVAFGEA